jgi:hypothetical protein
MPGYHVLSAIGSVVLLSASLSFAQTTQPDPRQLQEIRAIQMQIDQNMRASGIDPAVIARQISRSVDNGTFDPVTFQQQLLDQGVLTPQMVNRMNELGINPANPQQGPAAAQRGKFLRDLQQQLGASDEEWKVLAPKIERLLKALENAGRSDAVGAPGLVLAAQPPAASLVGKAINDLRAASASQTTTSSDFEVKLKVLHDARDNAVAEIAAARKDLATLLTQRQEGVLVAMGLLE